ncbi:ATP-binding protein [Anaerosporobacter sp.]
MFLHSILTQPFYLFFIIFTAIWYNLHFDPVIANAILDRVLHHSHVVNITGKSYRLKEYINVDDE